MCPEAMESKDVLHRWCNDNHSYVSGLDSCITWYSAN